MDERPQRMPRARSWRERQEMGEAIVDGSYRPPAQVSSARLAAQESGSAVRSAGLGGGAHQRVIEGIVIWRATSGKGDVTARLMTPGGTQTVTAFGGAGSRQGRNMPLFQHLALTVDGSGRRYPAVSESSLRGALKGFEDPMRLACASLLGDILWRTGAALPPPSRDQGGGWIEQRSDGSQMLFQMLAGALQLISSASDPIWPATVMGWRLLARSSGMRDLAGEQRQLAASGRPRMDPELFEMLSLLQARGARAVLDAPVSPALRRAALIDMQRWTRDQVGELPSLGVLLEMLNIEEDVRARVAQG